MSKGNKEEQKWLLGESLNQYDRSLKEELNKVEKRNREQNHKISALINAFDDDYIKKEEENTNISLEYSKEGIVIVDDIKGNTLVNNVKDSNKELVLNGDIDTQGINNITLEDTVNGGKVDIALEGNTMVNVCDQEEPIAITKNYEVTTVNHIALQGEYDGKCRPNIYGNTLVNLVDFENFVDTVGGNVSYENGIITLTETEYWASFTGKLPLKVSTKYTLVVNVIENTTGSRIYINNVEEQNSYFENFAWYSTEEMGISKFVVTTKADITDKIYSVRTDGTDKNGNYAKIQLMLLEGDYTNKPIPDYFTGMKSSFEDKYIPENLYKFSSRDDFYALDNNVTLDGEYIKMTANGKYQNAVLKPLDTIKPSTTYTIVTNVIENTLDSRLVITTNTNDAQLPSAQPTIVNAGKTGIFTQLVTTGNDLSGCIRCLVNFLDIANTTGSIKYRIMVVEGDYTNYDFTDYDSTKGGKYKIDYKITGKNKFDKSKTLNGYEITDVGNGTIGANLNWFVTDFIPVIPNTSYKISGKANGNAVLGYNENKQFIANFPNAGTVGITIPNNVRYIKLNGMLKQKDTFQIEEGDTATTYEPYKEFTKTLYLNSPLLEGDTIEDINGKATHVHRYGKVVLDGSNDEKWIDNAGEGDTINGHSIYTRVNIYSNGECMCDKLPVYNSSKEVENLTDFVVLYNNELVVVNVKGATTIKEVKSWLQSNPITLISKLKTPTYETISNDSILCDSYVNGHLDVDSVIPIDKVVFQSYGTSLKYLSPNTEYTIQFESDSNGKLDALALNSSDVIGNLNIVKGINKFNITTSDEITINYLWTTGIGFNMSKIVVTPKVDGDFGYFKGMKSVGQNDVGGHKIEILSQNKNLIDINRFKLKSTDRGTLSINGDVITFNYKKSYPTIKQDFTQEEINLLKGKKLKFGHSGITDTVENNSLNIRLVTITNGVNKYYMFPYNENYTSTVTLPNNIQSLEFSIVPNNTNNSNIQGTFTISKPQLVFADTENTNYVKYSSNKKEILMNEPLRGLPNGVRDKYVMIDGKWYIQRNTGKVVLDGSQTDAHASSDLKNVYRVRNIVDTSNIDISDYGVNTSICDRYIIPNENYYEYDAEHYYLDNGYIWLFISKSLCNDTLNDVKTWLSNNPIPVVYTLKTPTYEPIDYNPFEVYTDITHISNNSIIPCNMVIKNTGYNCILKPSTLYTIALDTNKSGTIGMNLGGGKGTTTNNIATITTPATLTDNTLRLYGKGIKGSKVRLLEGDKTNWIPSHFEGMKSCFEDKVQDDGKYKVTVLSNNRNLLDEKNIMSYVNATINNGVITTINFSKEYGWFRLKLSNTYKLEPGTYYLQLKMRSDSCKGIINEVRFEDVPDIKYLSYSERLINPVCNSDYQVYELKYVTTKPLDIKYIFIQGTLTTGKNLQLKDFMISRIQSDSYISYQSNKIQFLLNEPLRAVGDVKDKVYIKEDKIVVQRNCASKLFDGSADEYWAKYSTNDDQYRTTNRTSVFYITVDNKKIGWNTSVCNNFTNTGNADAFSMSKCTHGMYTDHVDLKTLYIDYGYDNTITLKQFRQYLQQNPITVVYQLEEPIYEEIEYSSNRLTLNTYDNSTLFYYTNIPVSNTSFKPLWEELVYVKNSTTYYIQFNAVGSGNVVVNLGGTELSATITEGYNKIEIITPNNSTNLLTIDGQGIKISKVVVSEVLCGGYYKGLQSCFEEHMENGKYVCVVRGISLDGNKVNGIKFYLNEPLRGIGNTKDRLCIKDNKLMVERNCNSIILNDSDDKTIWIDGASEGCVNTKLYATRPTNHPFGKDNGDMIANNLIVRNIYNTDNIDGMWYRGNAFRIRMFNSKLSTQDLAGFKKYLQQNPITVIYQLATPVYEEITNEYGLPIILEGYENGIVYVDSAVTPTTSIKYTSNNTVPTTLSNVDNLNTTTQDDINNNIVTYMMDIDMMLTEMEMEDNASVMSLSDSDDNNQKHNHSYNNILDRMNEEDRIKYQDNTTKMLEKVIKGKSLTNEENINRIDLYLSEGKIREEQSNYLKELLKEGE